MNTELFIARKIYRTHRQEGKKASPPAVLIAIAGVALGLAIMIVAVSVVIGFKKEVSNKVIGFGSHIQITNFDNNTSYETTPIDYSRALTDTLSAMPAIGYYQRFATKPGIIKTENDVEGMVMKGIGPEYDTTFIADNLIAGTMATCDDEKPSNDVVISKHIADRINLTVGDSFLAYFLQGNVKARKLTVKGIYETGFTDYDKLFVIGDIRTVQRLNEWDSSQVSGVEITLKRFETIDQTADDLYFALEKFKSGNGELSYYVRSIKEISPQIFSWLELLDMNVWVILILMALVAGFTMISGLLILILERTNMIGILKALGTQNYSIRKVFLYISTFLIGRGLIFGNLIGVGAVCLQHYFHIVKLDPATYYVSYTPVEVNLLYIALLNIGTLIVTLLMLIGPSMIVSKISPVKAIRFE